MVDSISYLTNALDDLVRMGIDIATEKGFGFAVFDHEGAASVVAETAWIEGNSWHSGARLSVVRNLNASVEPTWKWRETVQADLVVQFSSRDQLARSFLDAAVRVRDQHNEEGYRELWDGRLAFPRRAVAALECALTTAVGEVAPYG